MCRIIEWHFRFLHGMYAFGLVETNFYNEAEKHAQQVSTTVESEFMRNRPFRRSTL